MTHHALRFTHYVNIMKDIHKILFVCTGNSCRSIMAEAYFRKRAEEEGFSMEVRSAGTLGREGMAPTKEALTLIEKEGITTYGLESKAFTPELAEWADLILVMEPEHKTRALFISEGAKEKVFYLGEFNPERGDLVIPDPIGRPLAFYRASFRLIKQSIEGLIKWLAK